MTIRLEAVQFTYPDGRRPALDGCTLSCAAGRVTGVLGAPGAGASTLLRVAAGLAPAATGGTLTGLVQVLGAEPSPVVVGYVAEAAETQLSGIAERVRTEVAFGPANLGRPRDAVLAVTQRALERLGIVHLAERPPAALSGGEIQRVVLAAALALDAPVLLLDEPVAAVDAEGRQVVSRLLRDEAARGRTVVVACEESAFLLEVADDLVVLAEGRVALQGEPRALLARADLRAFGVGSTPIAELARVADPRGHAEAVPLTLEEGILRWR